MGQDKGELLADLLDEASETLEPIIVERRGKPCVAIIEAAEFSSIIEKLHLLRSPANAKALFKSLEQARSKCTIHFYEL